MVKDEILVALHLNGEDDTLSEQYNLGSREPNIQVWSVNLRGDRSLTLRHFMHQRQPLGKTTDEVLKHVCRLWGFDVRLESVDQQGQILQTHECKAPEHNSLF